jgi:hypothetical protein
MIYYEDENESSSYSSMDYSDENEEENDGFDNIESTISNNLSNEGSFGVICFLFLLFLFN